MRAIHVFTCALALTISAPVVAQDTVKKTPPVRAPRPEPEPEPVTAASPVEKADEGTETEAAPPEPAAIEPESAPVEQPEVAAEPPPRPKRWGSKRWRGHRSRGCSPTHVAAVLDRRGDSLVRVEAPGARGLGVVFHSHRHVLTALSIVERGRGIKVLFKDEQWNAEVVAMDRDNDLALLEIDGEAPGAPLQLANSSPSTGEAVIALRMTHDARHPEARRHRGHVRRRWQRPADTIADLGVVNVASAGSFRSDALRGHHDSWGAPLLDCRGRVVGVATSPVSDEAVAVGPVRELLADVGDESVYDGRWSIFNPSLGLVGQMTHTVSPGFGKRDKWLGFSVGTALIGDDRWYFPARFSATFLVAPDLEEPFAERDGFRVQGSAGLGYRLMLKGGGVPVYLVPVVGATLMFERITTERTEFWLNDVCSDPPCQAVPSVVSVEQEQLRFMPTFGGGLQVGPAEAAYQFILDTEHHEFSVHQLTLGAQF